MRPGPRSSRDERIGLLAAALAAIVYGAAYPATAVALRSFSPLAIAGLSCTVALPLVIALAGARVIARPSVAGLDAARLMRLAALAGLGGIGFIAAINVAVALSGATITGFIAPLYAVLATLFAIPILGERVRPVAIASFALAIAGTALLADLGSSDGSSVLGAVIAFAGAAMFGLYMVLARRWSRPYRLDGTLVTIANLLGRGPLLLAVAFVIDPGGVLPADPDPAAVVALLTIVVGSSTSGNLLLMASVRRVPAGRTAAALLLTPIASAVIAAVVLGERLTPAGLVGAAMILLGIAGASGLLGRRPRAPDAVA
jgi:drug/metabolite transporter, DME family